MLKDGWWIARRWLRVDRWIARRWLRVDWWIVVEKMEHVSGMVGDDWRMVRG
jgi:hypothetical protein